MNKIAAVVVTYNRKELLGECVSAILSQEGATCDIIIIDNVRDGPSALECTGDTGRYLKFNIPHKFSLYLSIGIPVIVWSRAACAALVSQYDVGLTINSLVDLNQILENVTKDRYSYLSRNSYLLGLRLRRGEFTKASLKKAIESFGETII